MSESTIACLITSVWFLFRFLLFNFLFFILVSILKLLLNLLMFTTTIQIICRNTQFLFTIYNFIAILFTRLIISVLLIKVLPMPLALLAWHSVIFKPLYQNSWDYCILLTTILLLKVLKWFISDIHISPWMHVLHTLFYFMYFCIINTRMSINLRHLWINTIIKIIRILNLVK